MSTATTMPPFPNITKGDFLFPARLAQIAADLHRDFYLTAEEAEAFLETIRKYVQHPEGAFRGASDDTSVLLPEMRSQLARTWDAVAFAFDPLTGRANPVYATELKKGGSTLQFLQDALQLAEANPDRGVESVLQELCTERQTPFPMIPRGLKELFSADEANLAEYKEAENRLNAARNRIQAARATAVGIVTTRDRLQNAIDDLRVELTELQQKHQLVSNRHAKAFKEMTRTLRPRVTIDFHYMADAGAVVASLVVVLAELARLVAVKQGEVTSAEKELADFLEMNADALTLVPRN